MSKTVAGVVVGAVAILIVGGLVLAVNSNDGNPSTTTDHSSMSEAEHQQSTNDTSNQADSSAQSSQAKEIEIKDYTYTPAKIQIKKGTKVTWTNQDSVRHDVSPDNESEDFEASKLLAKGESYSFTFNTVGTYSYHCSPHPYMKAAVEVTE